MQTSRSQPSRVQPIRLAITFLWCSLSVGALLAQAEPTQSLNADTDIEVRLVELDVRVVGRDGDPVEGLTAEDFVLRVDGEEVPVEHFTAVRPAPPPKPADAVAEVDTASGMPRAEDSGIPSLDIAPSTQEAANLIVYLDQHFLDEAELGSARLQLLKYLRQDLPAGTRVMLATADEQLRIVQSFTREPALVADSLQNLEIESGGSVWRTQYDLVMQEIQRYHDMGSAASAEVVSLGATASGGREAFEDGEFPLEATNNPSLGPLLEQGENKGPTELVETDPRYSLQMVEAFGQFVESGLGASASHIARLTRAASGLPGETSVLYVSGTLPVNATNTLFELWQDTYGHLSDGGSWVARTARDSAWSSGVADAALESGDRFSRALERLGRVADAASASGVTFHTLDVSVAGRLRRVGGDAENYRSGAELRGGSRSSDTRLAARSDAGAVVLADRTGGLTANDRRFENFFHRLSDHVSNRYTLAFSLAPPSRSPGTAASGSAGPEAGVHDVEIELRDPKAWGKPRLVHRRKVAVRSLEQEQIQRTISALALGLDLVGSEDNPLGIEVAAGAQQADADGALWVPVSVKVPMARLALVPDRQAHAGRLSIYVAVGDLERGVGLEKAVVPVRIANRDLLTAFGRTVDYRLEISAPVGAQRLAVTVRDDYRPQRSTLTTRLGSLEPKPGSADTARDAADSADANLGAEGTL